jgi:hypothetical protein
LAIEQRSEQSRERTTPTVASCDPLPTGTRE